MKTITNQRPIRRIYEFFAIVLWKRGPPYTEEAECSKEIECSTSQEHKWLSLESIKHATRSIKELLLLCISSQHNKIKQNLEPWAGSWHSLQALKKSCWLENRVWLGIPSFWLLTMGLKKLQMRAVISFGLHGEHYIFKGYKFFHFVWECPLLRFAFW